jgi:hypothetical protein
MKILRGSRILPAWQPLFWPVSFVVLAAFAASSTNGRLALWWGALAVLAGGGFLRWFLEDTRAGRRAGERLDQLPTGARALVATVGAAFGIAFFCAACVAVFMSVAFLVSAGLTPSSPF